MRTIQVLMSYFEPALWRVFFGLLVLAFAGVLRLAAVPVPVRVLRLLAAAPRLTPADTHRLSGVK